MYEFSSLTYNVRSSTSSRFDYQLKSGDHLFVWDERWGNRQDTGLRLWSEKEGEITIGYSYMNDGRLCGGICWDCQVLGTREELFKALLKQMDLRVELVGTMRRSLGRSMREEAHYILRNP